MFDGISAMQLSCLVLQDRTPRVMFFRSPPHVARICPPHVAQIRRSRPDSGLGLKAKAFKTFRVVPSSLARLGFMLDGFSAMQLSCIVLRTGVPRS